MYIDFGLSGCIVKDKDEDVIESTCTDVEGLNGEQAWILICEGNKMFIDIKYEGPIIRSVSMRKLCHLLYDNVDKKNRLTQKVETQFIPKFATTALPIKEYMLSLKVSDIRDIVSLCFDDVDMSKFGIHHHKVMIVYDDIYQDSIYSFINDHDDPSINTSPKLSYYPSLLPSSVTSIDPSPNPNVDSTFLMYPSSHNIECRTDPGKRLKDPMQKWTI